MKHLDSKNQPLNHRKCTNEPRNEACVLFLKKTKVVFMVVDSYNMNVYYLNAYYINVYYMNAHLSQLRVERMNRRCNRTCFFSSVKDAETPRALAIAFRDPDAELIFCIWSQILHVQVQVRGVHHLVLRQDFCAITYGIVTIVHYTLISTQSCV